jgi:hypothetical protein
MNSVHFSALSMHYPQCKTLRRASVVCYITDITLSRMTLGASVSLLNHGYNAVADDSWRKCRLLHHGYNAVADNSWVGSHLVPRILHWLLTEKVEKIKKGKMLWVHTYSTTSSRPRGRCVQSLVQIDSKMWICVSSILTNKQTFIFVYKIQISLNFNFIYLFLQLTLCSFLKWYCLVTWIWLKTEAETCRQLE